MKTRVQTGPPVLAEVPDVGVKPRETTGLAKPPGDHSCLSEARGHQQTFQVNPQILGNNKLLF